nr:MAG: hypothetical protein J07AB56_07800 [Candidatus Nanosalinarum sp. J07AB56]
MDEVDLYQFENSLRNCDGLPWDLINEAIVENIPDNGSKPTPAEARQQLAEIQEFNGKYKQFRSEVNKAKQEAANKRASREQVEEYLGHDAKEVAKLGLEAALAIVRIVGYRKPNRNQRISKAESVEEEAEIVEEISGKLYLRSA